MLSLLDVIIIAVIIACAILGYAYFRIEEFIHKWEVEQEKERRADLELRYRCYKNY